MLKYYKPIAKCWLNKEEFDIGYLYKDTISDEKPTSNSMQCGWDKIGEFENNFPYKILPWGVKPTRKGLKIYMLNDLGFADNSIKQWKTNLEFKFELNWVECSPSINELLKYRNGETAIQYIVERGLNVIKRGEMK